ALANARYLITWIVDAELDWSDVGDADVADVAAVSHNCADRLGDALGTGSTSEWHPREYSWIAVPPLFPRYHSLLRLVRSWNRHLRSTSERVALKMVLHRSRRL